MLILPDHPTPVSVRTHTGDPVPYLLFDSRNAVQGLASYDEESARSSGITEEVGHTLISHLFEQK